MPRVSELPKPSGKLKVLIVGAPGAGKTALAATFPKPAFLDTDAGHSVLQSKWFKRWAPGADPIVEVFDDEYDEYGIFKKAKAFWEVINKYNEWVKDPDIETIVIDSLTSLSVLAMHVGLEVNKSSDKSKSLAHVGKAKVGMHHVLLQTQADYGSEMNAIEQMLDQVKGHNKHVVVLAHERTERNDSGGTVRIEPLMTGDRNRGKVGYWFDEAWYLDVIGSGDRAVRVLQTNRDNKLKFVKTRLGVEDGIRDPNFEKIKASIEG